MKNAECRNQNAEKRDSLLCRDDIQLSHSPNDNVVSDRQFYKISYKSYKPSTNFAVIFTKPNLRNMKLIYYADDDLDDLNIFQDAADGQGYIVVVFFTGQELYETLLATPKKPDLIFLDVQMPLTQGDEILKMIRIHEEYTKVPVILVTGSLPPSKIERYIGDGASYLVRKMNSLFLFREQIAEILHKDWENYKPHTDDFIDL